MRKKEEKKNDKTITKPITNRDKFDRIFAQDPF